MFIYSNLVYFFFPIYIQHYQKSSYIKYHKIIHVSYRQLTSYFQLNKPNKNKRFTFTAFTIKNDLFPNDLFTLTDPTLCHISVKFIYIEKVQRNIYCCYALVESHQRSRHYLISFQFFFLTFTFFFLMFSLSLTFLSSLLFFYLPTTLYFNITLYLSFYLLSFCLFLFKQFYNQFVILSSILCIVFSHKKNSLSLSLSLSLFLVDFLFILLASLLQVYHS